jgi:hypothetical protein
MIQTYSRTLLSPFVGRVQVAETARARALSLDGQNWAIQYSLAKQPKRHANPIAAGPDGHFSLVATIVDGQVKRHALHPFLDAGHVRSAIDRLSEAVIDARLPFAAADRYQYWLMDGSDGTPLALLHSCVEREHMVLKPPPPVWLAMPAAQLEVPAPEEHRGHYVPPVNYRLQKLVEERAGAKPQAAWFERSSPVSDDFPPCLIQEHWAGEEQQQLCDRYIERLAPRLLMLDGLPQPVRRRLERAARRYAFDIERFHALYPEVLDEELIAAARVEAQFRRAARA